MTDTATTQAAAPPDAAPRAAAVPTHGVVGVPFGAVSTPADTPYARNAGPTRHLEVYTAGMMQGVLPTVPPHFPELERQAQSVVSREAWAYINGGAGHQDTIAENRRAFQRWRIVPRRLRDVSQRDTSVTLFGRTYPAPLLLCPIGVQEMVHAEADLATARAAASLGVPMVFSNQASVPMETCAGAMGSAPRWFQLYWSRSDEFAMNLVRRAEACGAEAIAITLDTTILGWRPYDLELGFLPFLKAQGIAQYTSDPVFRAMLPQPPEENPLAAAALFSRIYSEPAITWERIRLIREHTRLPILLKGILHAEDAARAVAEGIDGIWVSNHGGRQIDGEVSALQALPAVADAVRGRVPIVFDSGIRSGSDVFKALALGATVCGVGRPFVYGLALAGEAGVRQVLADLMGEFDLTLGLAGCRSVAEITRDRLVVAGV